MLNNNNDDEQNQETADFVIGRHPAMAAIKRATGRRHYHIRKLPKL